MKQGKREPKRDSETVIQRETVRKRGLHTGTNCVMQARSVASKTAGQLDSVILCVARFKNFNSQTAVQLSAQTM